MTFFIVQYRVNGIWRTVAGIYDYATAQVNALLCFYPSRVVQVTTTEKYKKMTG